MNVEIDAPALANILNALVTMVNERGQLMEQLTRALPREADEPATRVQGEKGST